MTTLPIKILKANMRQNIKYSHNIIMLKRIILISIPVLIASGAVYLYWLNSDKVTLTLSADTSFELPLAVLILGTLALGVFLTLLYTAFLAISKNIQIGKSKKTLKIKQENIDTISNARAERALGNFEKAESIFLKIISKEEDNILARIFLAETLDDQGKTKEALQILDESRIEDKSNIELLLLASKLNQKAGNITAAFDNAKLALKKDSKSLVVLRRLVELSNSIHKLDEAKEAQKQIIKLSSFNEREKEQEILAEIEFKKAKLENKQIPTSYKKALEEILQNHRDFPPALSELALLNLNESNLNAAAKLWTKAFKESGDVKYLEPLAAMWIKSEQPDKALASVSNAISSFNKSDTLNPFSQIFFINLLIYLEKLDDAKKELTKIKPALIHSQKFGAMISVLEAELLRRESNNKEALDVTLNALSELERLPGANLFKTASKATNWQKSIIEEKKSTAPDPSLMGA